MTGFSPGVVEKSPAAAVEQLPLDSPPLWVLHEAVFLGRWHAIKVQGVSDIRKVTEVIEGVGVLPSSLRVRQFCRGDFPALPRPCRVSMAHEAKRIPLPAGTGQLRAY